MAGQGFLLPSTPFSWTYFLGSQSCRRHSLPERLGTNLYQVGISCQCPHFHRRQYSYSGLWGIKAITGLYKYLFAGEAGLLRKCNYNLRWPHKSYLAFLESYRCLGFPCYVKRFSLHKYCSKNQSLWELYPTRVLLNLQTCKELPGEHVKIPVLDMGLRNWHF